MSWYPGNRSARNGHFHLIESAEAPKWVASGAFTALEQRSIANCNHRWLPAAANVEQQRMAEGSRASRSTASAGSRSQAHVRSMSAGGRCLVRGPTGSTRSSVGAHHHALLDGGVAEPVGSVESCVRGEVPQKSRTDDSEKKSACRGCGKRLIFQRGDQGSRPATGDSVEKLQIGFTQNLCERALQSTTCSGNCQSVCQKSLGRAQRKIARSPTSEKERRLCRSRIFRVASEKEFFNRIGQLRSRPPLLSPTEDSTRYRGPPRTSNDQPTD
jgi:hypothetical protein